MKKIVIVGLFLWLWYTVREMETLTDRVQVLEQLTVGMKEDGVKL